MNDVLFSGILFCLLPTLFLVPKLYGKIEPLLGMAPRTKETALGAINPKVIIGCVIAFAAAVCSEMLLKAAWPLLTGKQDGQAAPRLWLLE